MKNKSFTILKRKDHRGIAIYYYIGEPCNNNLVATMGLETTGKQFYLKVY